MRGNTFKAGNSGKHLKASFLLAFWPSSAGKTSLWYQVPVKDKPCYWLNCKKKRSTDFTNAKLVHKEEVQHWSKYLTIRSLLSTVCTSFYQEIIWCKGPKWEKGKSVISAYSAEHPLLSKHYSLWVDPQTTKMCVWVFLFPYFSGWESSATLVTVKHERPPIMWPCLKNRKKNRKNKPSIYFPKGLVGCVEHFKIKITFLRF